MAYISVVEQVTVNNHARGSSPRMPTIKKYHKYGNKLNMTEYEQLKEFVNKIQSGYYLVFGSENLLISDIEYLCKVYRKKGYMDGSDRMYKLLVGVEN